MKNLVITWIVVCCLAMFFGLAVASSDEGSSGQVGTITQIEGDVRLLTNPTKTVKSQGPQVLFEGEYYYVKSARVGDTIEKRNVVRTALNAKAKVVFGNGDQFIVGPATEYRIEWDQSARTNLQIRFGKMRAVISKKGLRKNLLLRTNGMTLGVRGTDFFVRDEGSGGVSEVAVLRGSVEVKTTGVAKAVAVKSGQKATVDVPVPADKAPPTPIEVQQTSKQDLAIIQKASVVLKKEAAAASSETTKKIVELENKATEVTLDDIKKEDPKLFAQISQKRDEIRSAEDLNTVTVVNLVKTAPAAPAKLKPRLDEVEDLEGEAYKRYFKIVE